MALVNTHLGWIEVICGSMFSGKSEELIRRLRRAIIAKQRVQIFKPVIDSRYSDAEIVSHSEMRLPSVSVADSRELLEKLDHRTEVIGIDEAQFFDEGIIEACQKLADQGKRVLIAGLDKDFRGAPFGPIPRLMAVAEDVTKTLEDMRERAAAFAPAEGRPVQDGDFVQLKLTGTPEGEGEPLQADSVLCHIGAEETMTPFNESLRGVNIRDHKDFDVPYPADYPDAKLAGKTYHYSVDVLGIKTKKLPELNDDFAKDVSDATTLDELNKKIREGLEHQRDHKQKDLLREKVLGEIVKLHDFPVPQSLVEHQMDVRLERVVRSLAQQGVDPRAVNIDWVSLRKRNEDRAKDDVKAELIVDRIATAENIDVTEEEVEHELQHLAGHSNESAEAIRARLTKQGTLDRIKAKLRSDKTLDWLAQNARVSTTAAAAGAK